jgi:hypothetical protein
MEEQAASWTHLLGSRRSLNDKMLVKYPVALPFHARSITIRFAEMLQTKLSRTESTKQGLS